MARVRGSTTLKVEPFPTSVTTFTSPESFSIFVFTTSIPTPRPEISETSAFVENPGWKTKLTNSSSLK